VADRRLRVLYVVGSFRAGGAQRHCLALWQRLDRDRFDPRICCEERNGLLLEDVMSVGMPVIELGVRKLASAKALSAMHRLSEYIKNERIDIVHSYLFETNILAVAAARMARRGRVIISVRAINNWMGWRHRTANRLVNRFADSITVVSHAVESSVIEKEGADPEKVRVIPNGVEVSENGPPRHVARDSARSRLDLHRSGPVVGCVANFNRYKDHSTLVQAAQTVVADLPESTFVLVGDGPLRATIEEQVHTVGLDANFVFTGAILDASRAMPAFDLFVLPSLEEGMPNVVLEAMAAGVPVVATDVGGTPEVVVDGKTGLLVPPRCPASLAAAVTELIRDTERAEQMGVEGRMRIASEFSLERMVDAVQDLYVSLGRRNDST